MSTSIRFRTRLATRLVEGLHLRRRRQCPGLASGTRSGFGKEGTNRAFPYPPNHLNVELVNRVGERVQRRLCVASFSAVGARRSFESGADLREAPIKRMKLLANVCADVNLRHGEVAVEAIVPVEDDLPI